MTRALINVRLKNGVLDPQGEAIQHALKTLGFQDIASIRQGKLFDIELKTENLPQAETTLKEMCEKLLVNGVIENYTVELL